VSGNAYVLREGAGMSVAELMRIKAEGDYTKFRDQVVQR
jgi:hypothetical protein